MKISILLVLCVGALLGSCVPADAIAADSAPVPGSSGASAVADSEKDDGPPAWVAPEAVSQSWVDDCQSRIDKAWGKTKKGNQISDNTRCVFFLKPNGKLEDYFVYSAGAPKFGDDVALKVVRKAAPFKNPPAYLLPERRVLVSFSRVDGQARSRLSWDNFDYTFVKPEDRLKEFPLKKPKHHEKKN